MKLAKPNLMFDSVPLNPPDSIFGLIEQFKKDTNAEKINLSVGVYQDEAGKTPLMECVAAAEKRLVENRSSKTYLPIDGLPGYNRAIAKLIMGEGLIDQVHCRTAQTPGGTTALRVAGDVLRRVLNVNTIWMSDPTWANHPQIYTTVGLEIKKYDYLDGQGTGLDFDRMLNSLSAAGQGDAVLLHTVCHNPTGVDLSVEQWIELSGLVRERNLIPIFDFAYQGFGSGVEEDAFPIRYFSENGFESLICNSFSKNFGLYGERVGGITAVAANDDAANAMLSQIKKTIRTAYSNPPLHGAAIVDTVLNDSELRQKWENELAEIRERIQYLRGRFVERMSQLVPDYDFAYVNRQRGMFSYSGLNTEQVNQLRDKHSIYALGTGRINIAGINMNNIERICAAIAGLM